MTLPEIIIILLLAVLVCMSIVFFVLLSRKKSVTDNREVMEKLAKNEERLIHLESQNDYLSKALETLRQDNQRLHDETKNQLNGFVTIVSDTLVKNNKEFMSSFSESVAKQTSDMKERLGVMDLRLKEKLEDLKKSNDEKLAEMKGVIDEKLQASLEKKINESFSNVIEQITSVNKVLGEIKGLASDVGSLKTVLSGVKTKGIVGEVLLGNLIKEVLAPSQYAENVATKKNSSCRVEYALILPGSGEDSVYLPIDSKFPTESYHKITDGYNAYDKAMIEEGRKELRSNIRAFAKDIQTKYIEVPSTTDFAIMFLPTESLYNEVISMGLLEEIQHDFHICISGPSNFLALLNSLQMGFKTLAIQKKSKEVFDLLGAVKNEFGKFQDVLEKSLSSLNKASDDLTTLVTTRTRLINSKLSSITVLDDARSEELLDK